MERRLFDGKDAVRRAALVYLYGVSDQGGLVSLLERVLGSTRYYYDVVTRLDRILCAPAVLRPWYEAELRAFDSDAV